MNYSPKLIQCAACQGIGEVVASAASTGGEVLTIEECSACSGTGRVRASLKAERETVRGLLHRLLRVSPTTGRSRR